MPDPTPIQLAFAFTLAPERAIAYLESLGVVVTWEWQRQLEAIQERAFTIARVAQAEVIQTVLDELKIGQKRGTPWTDWQGKTEKMLQQKGWAKRSDGSAWRLDTIYRTNLQSSFQAGRYEQMQASTIFEFWEYRAVGDKRSRPKHAELDGLILPKGHAFWKRVFPPNGYNCRCSVTALTRKQALARGYKEPIGTTAVTPSGQVVDLNAWQPDTGFAGVPGQTWEPDSEKFDPGVREALQEDLQRG